MEQLIITMAPWHTIELPLWRERLLIFGKSYQGSLEEMSSLIELLIFAGSENKIQLHDWLSQIALYYLASGIIADSQKIVCALTRLCAPTSTYMKSYYDKIQVGQSVGS